MHVFSIYLNLELQYHNGDASGFSMNDSPFR